VYGLWRRSPPSRPDDPKRSSLRSRRSWHWRAGLDQRGDVLQPLDLGRAEGPIIERVDREQPASDPAATKHSCGPWRYASGMSRRDLIEDEGRLAPGRRGQRSKRGRSRSPPPRRRSPARGDPSDPDDGRHVERRAQDGRCQGLEPLRRVEIRSRRIKRPITTCSLSSSRRDPTAVAIVPNPHSLRIRLTPAVPRAAAPVRGTSGPTAPLTPQPAGSLHSPQDGPRPGSGAGRNPPGPPARPGAAAASQHQPGRLRIARSIQIDARPCRVSLEWHTPRRESSTDGRAPPAPRPGRASSAAPDRRAPRGSELARQVSSDAS